MEENILELINVAKHYISPGRTEPQYVLNSITLQITSGESVAITGPSGSGKSTLLNIIGTLDRPNAGKVLLEGRDLAQLSDKELAIIRNRQIGFIFQLHHLLPQCTVLENILVPALVNKSYKNEARTYAERLLERVGLKDRMLYRPGQLSGGERQRVAVVRALINHPKLLLADEPTGALDHIAAENLIQLLVELNSEEKVTLILVTHALELAARMSRVLKLRDGFLT